MNIAIVGEAWGEEEAKQRLPFVGYSGRELTKMLGEAGIDRRECFLTNVFNRRPQGNKIEDLCGPKSEAIEGYPGLGQSKYIRKEFTHELQRLGRELEQCNPNVVVALGNTAMWAMLGRTAISRYRGVIDRSTHTYRGVKVLPTYHPAAVCRQWELRPTTIIDLIKARRESAGKELNRPRREIWIEPTLEDIDEFTSRYIQNFLSVDIETAGDRITCVGLAPNPARAIVIPFRSGRGAGGNYWDSFELERDAWRRVRTLLEDEGIRKVFQNGLYDIAFLYRAVGIEVRSAEDDTMLLHHALQPEALKGLGYLGSIYTDEGAWKQMRTKSKWKTIKRDE